MTAVAAPSTRTARRTRAATQPAMPPGKKARWATANVITIAWTLFPIWWLIALSFKDPATLSDGSFWPQKWSWANYSGIFHGSAFVRPLINSIGIGIISTVISVVLGTMAAYAIARLKFPGKGLLIGVSLLIAMFPLISLVTPLFNIERALGLFDTWPGLIIPYLAFSLPLTIYTLSAFFREIPWDLEKAAKVDGASQRQIFLDVIAPLALPGIATTAILVFMFCWNEFLLAISLTSTNAARTAPAAMGFFTGVSQFTFPIGSIAAAAVVITIPIVIFVMIFQRRIVAGLTAGAVKG
jgi:multiple sugar transport system permease protein